MMSTATCPQSLLRQAIWPLDPTTILVVDDDTELVEAIGRRLTQQKFDVLIAKNGAQGRALAKRRHPDLILLDVRLPDMSGLDLCQELTDAPATCGIPVILISGSDQADVIRRSRAAGSEYFVRKPYDPKALLALIRHALTASRTWPHAAEEVN
jgi:DNA-binding response OmpR family regulator